MIPSVGCDPKINIITIGATILERLRISHCSIDSLLVEVSSELEISMDHIILSLDWLFAIQAINSNGEEVALNETK